jgi:hypothetical protein
MESPLKKQRKGGRELPPSNEEEEADIPETARSNVHDHQKVLHTLGDKKLMVGWFHS